MFTQENLKKLYRYDAQKGELLKIDGHKRKDADKRTATYSSIILNGRLCKEHRAIWIWHNGAIPEGLMIDHKDGNTSNNRIENLRLCNRSQNNCNRVIGRNNKTGYKGVSRSGTKYLATISNNKKIECLGRHETAVDAAMAYDAAAAKLYGEFAKTNRSLGLL